MRFKHFPILVGIALPLVFVLIVAFMAFIPSLSVNPAYDFIYSGNGYYSGPYLNKYKVVNNRLSLEPVVLRDQLSSKGEAPKIFLYRVKDNSVHEISLQEAVALNLDPGPSSPDGYTVNYDYGHNGIFELFGSDNSNRGYFITKDRARKKLTGFGNNMYGSDFNFIGWIKP